jgi:hypothetical protein
MFLELIPLLAIFCTMVVTVAVVLMVTRSRQRRLELQAEVQTKLIDRFSSAPELIEFLQSPTGRQFVSGVQTGPARYARERVIGGVSRAIVTLMIGVAFMVMWAIFGEFFAIPGILFAALGVGFLLSSFASYSLTLRMGLDDPLQQMAETPEALKR